MPTKTRAVLRVVYVVVDISDAFTIYVTKCVIVGLVSNINIHIRSIKCSTIFTTAAAAESPLLPRHHFYLTINKCVLSQQFSISMNYFTMRKKITFIN